MYLIGSGGHAKVIIDILLSQKKVINGLYSIDLSNETVKGIPVFHQDEIKHQDNLIIAVGDNKVRKQLAEKLNQNDFETAIHPSFIKGSEVALGPGSVIMAGAIVNCDTNIGKHTIINTSASVDHDCVIGDFVHIAPNATLTGGITIGEGSLIGAGAVILPNVSIGKWCVVGAGAVVTKDIEDGMKVAGNPAKKI